MKKKPRVPSFGGVLAQMATGEASDNDRAAIDAVLQTAIAIEKSGIVTGLLTEFLEGQAALNKYVTGQPLKQNLIDNIDWALASHRFQLKQLLARELADIVKKLRAQTASVKG